MNSVKPPLKTGVFHDVRFWGREYDPIGVKLYKYSPIYQAGMNKIMKLNFVVLPPFALDVKNKL